MVGTGESESTNVTTVCHQQKRGEIMWMPPAMREDTTPITTLGGREPTQTPAIWNPPSDSHLTMIITNNETGYKHNLAISGRGNIT